MRENFHRIDHSKEKLRNKIFARRRQRRINKKLIEYINFSHSTLLIHPTGTRHTYSHEIIGCAPVHISTLHARFDGRSDRKPDDGRKEKIHLRAAIVQRCVHFRRRLMIGRPKT